MNDNVSEAEKIIETEQYRRYTAYLDGINTQLSLVRRCLMAELTLAIRGHGPMVSPHEGYAILKEEVDELWDVVKVNPKRRSRTALAEEAVQVMAMSTRFLVDLFTPEELDELAADLEAKLAKRRAADDVASQMTVEDAGVDFSESDVAERGDALPN